MEEKEPRLPWNFGEKFFEPIHSLILPPKWKWLLLTEEKVYSSYMNIAAIQLSEFLGEYIRLLHRQRDAIVELQRRTRRGTDTFEAWQRVLLLEVELQLAFERIGEVLETVDLNPYIDEKCRHVILSSGESPEESLAASLELLDHRERLIGELTKYLLLQGEDMIAERGPEYVVQGFIRRWEEGLRRLEKAAEK